MSIEVKIPALGESISSGILAVWHVQDGDYVESGSVIYELETDKITSEGVAEAAGTITLKVAEGDEVEIGAVVATIDESATKPDAPNKSGSEAGKSSAPDEAPSGNPSSSFEPSPAVRRIAAETGIDPANLTGSGKDGRVTKGDMLDAARKKSSSAMPSQPHPEPAPEPARESSSASATSDSQRPVTRRKMTPLRRRIAERLVHAQQTAAILTTFNEVDMSAIMALRNQHKQAFIDRHGVKLGFMSFFVKASVHALQAVPQVNAQVEGDTILQNDYYDIGVAVSTPRGLLVPVVRNCHTETFAGIEKQILEYGKKGKDGKISIEDLQGGVFTITNGGIFGSMLSTPILNEPQSGILGMHNIVQRPVAVNGEVVIRPMMYLALSYDHRIVDGREAVTFLVKVKEAIEDPSRLLLEI